jgi:hypothetical protein
VKGKRKTQQNIHAQTVKAFPRIPAAAVLPRRTKSSLHARIFLATRARAGLSPTAKCLCFADCLMRTQIPFRLLSLATLSILTGCASLHTVNVQEDAALAGASVVVDVVPETGKGPNLETCSVRDYWRPGSSLRQAGAATTLRFGQGQSQTQSVTKSWQSMGAKKVVVLADLPGVFQDLPGDSDPRRKIIPVGKSATVTVRITPSGLSVDSN